MENNSVVTKGIATGTFTADSINHDLEYIGAPGGTEDNSATGTYVGFGYRYGIKYPKEELESRQFIHPPVVDENVRLYDGKLFNMKDYYSHGVFDANAAIQDGVPTRAAIRYMIEDTKKELEGSKTYSEMLEDKYQEQLTREMNVYDKWLVGTDVKMGVELTGCGLYTKLNLETPTGSATMYYPTGEEPKTVKDLVDDYSKLSNVNINNGQNSTFCFSSFKDKPAPNTFDELVKRQQEFKQRVQSGGASKNKTMKTSRVIELTESDVNAAIQACIKGKLSGNETSQTIIYFTGVRGDYDKGNAKEYVKKVIVEIDE